MAVVLVTGGSGTLGREVVPRLLAGGHRVRVLCHSPHSSPPAGAEVQAGDLATGAGLPEAADGVDVIVHAASNAEDSWATDVEGTRRLLQASTVAGVRPHIVYVSVVGVDRTTYPYYAAKRAAEALIEEGDLPWSILRATQFHSFARRVIQSLGADDEPVVTVPVGVRLQSIDGGEVADSLVALVELGPIERVSTIGGPEVLSLEEMTEAYLAARGRTAQVESAPIDEGMFDAWRSGVNLTPDNAVGTLTWEAFLEREYSR
jgi:uncharacterized protein YbjT (DUF2867 family)